MKRVHLCCGNRYLDGYINVDRIPARKGFPSNKVTLDNYYDHPLHENRDVFYDLYMDIERDWFFEPESVDEFVMVSAFEHFSRESAERLLQNVYVSLKYGGVFKFDFPDIESTICQYKTRPEYMMRLIYGSQKNEGGFHRWGYTPETIKEKLMKNLWREIVFEDIVKHEYPMQGVRAIK